MMNNKIVIALIILLLAGNLAISFWSLQSQPKIAYVRSADLVEGYLGMQEARKQYQEKQQEWKANLDTLERTLKAAVKYYEQTQMDKPEKRQQEDKINRLQTGYQQYRQNVQELAAKEDEKMTRGVYNQVSTFVRDYAEKNGYHLIIGANHTSNVLYGEGNYDLTDEVLAALNQHYKGEI